VASSRPPRDPPTDEEWDRRSLEGEDPDSGDIRHTVRRLHTHADSLVAMAESRERWTVFRSFVRRFAFWMAAMVAGLSLFKEQLLSLIGKGPTS